MSACKHVYIGWFFVMQLPSMPLITKLGGSNLMCVQACAAGIPKNKQQKLRYQRMVYGVVRPFPRHTCPAL